MRTKREHRKKSDLTGGRGAYNEGEGGGKKRPCIHTHIHLDKFYQNFGPSYIFGRAPLSSFPAFQLSGGKGCVNYVHEVCRGEEHCRWYVCVMCAL